MGSEFHVAEGGERKCALVDDPWEYTVGGRKGCIVEVDGGRVYGTLSTAELGACAIPSDEVVFMWATIPMWPDALHVMHARGFVFRGIHLVWLKKYANGTNKTGMGALTASNVEVLLLGTRPGSSAALRPARRRVDEVALNGHSIKPQVVYDSVLGFCARHSLGRPVELFARCTERPGFDFGLGDQIDVYRGMSPAEVAFVSGQKRKAEKRARKAIARGKPKRPRRKTPKRPPAVLAALAAAALCKNREAAARYFTLLCPAAPRIVINQPLEYGVLLFFGTPSPQNIMRLDIRHGLHPNGLLVVEASARSLNCVIHAINALGNFRFATLLFFVYHETDATKFMFYVDAVRIGARVQFFRRRSHKQTLGLSAAEWDDRQEHVLTAVSSVTGGARAAILTVGDGVGDGVGEYTVTEIGGSVSPLRDPISIGAIKESENLRKAKTAATIKRRRIAAQQQQ
jgi:N6-adenosine-specific RNA methylase IME4